MPNIETKNKRGNPNFGKPGYGNRFSATNQPTVKTKREKLLTEILESNKDLKKDLIEILKIQIDNAKSGDLESAKFVFDRVLGKANTFESSGENDSGTRIQQNILNVFANPDNLTNNDLLSILTAEKQEFIPIESE